jgi:hypothetical protein
MGDDVTEPEPTRPILRVVRGNPDDAELAAVTAVVAALASQSAPPAEEPHRSRWADRATLLRGPHRASPGAWQASAR